LSRRVSNRAYIAPPPARILGMLASGAMPLCGHHVDPYTDSATVGPPALAAQCATQSSGAPPPSNERDMTPRRRPQEPHRPRGGLSPLGRAHYSEGAIQAHKKAQRVTEDGSRREAARTAAVGDMRAKSPILTADLHAMLVAVDADRAAVGLTAHTMERFLLYLHKQVSLPHATH